MQNDAEKKQLDTTIALVATDDAGKIVYSKIDVAQILKGVTDTKSERKEKYGMKVYSVISDQDIQKALEKGIVRR